MGRRAELFTLVHRSPYRYFKLGARKRYQSAGETVKARARKIAMLAAEDASAGQSDRPLWDHAEQYFIYHQFTIGSVAH